MHCSKCVCHPDLDIMVMCLQLYCNTGSQIDDAVPRHFKLLSTWLLLVGADALWLHCFKCSVWCKFNLFVTWNACPKVNRDTNKSQGLKNRQKWAKQQRWHVCHRTAASNVPLEGQKALCLRRKQLRTIGRLYCTSSCRSCTLSVQLFHSTCYTERAVLHARIWRADVHVLADCTSTCYGATPQLGVFVLCNGEIHGLPLQGNGWTYPLAPIPSHIWNAGAM